MTGDGEAREERLPGGHVGGAVRVGGTVRRPAGPWAPAVHALLAHLAPRLPGVPEVLGLDDRGREVLSYLPVAISKVPLRLERRRGASGAPSPRARARATKPARGSARVLAGNERGRDRAIDASSSVGVLAAARRSSVPAPGAGHHTRRPHATHTSARARAAGVLSCPVAGSDAAWP